MFIRIKDIYFKILQKEESEGILTIHVYKYVKGFCGKEINIHVYVLICKLYRNGEKMWSVENNS